MFRVYGLTIGVLVGASVALGACETTRNVFRDRSELVAEPAVCSAKRFEVYFGEGQAQLTAPARAAIDLAARQLGDCEIRRVRVRGLADATGTAEANQSLSQRRAVTVAQALARAGWPRPAFELDAAGDAGAVTETGASEPMRRRTEVLIEAAPR